MDNGLSSTDKTNTCCNVCSPKISIISANCVWGLFTAIERSIIIPTLWLFLLSNSHWFTKEELSDKSENETADLSLVAKRYYGSTLAAFSLANMIAMPLFGWIATRKLLSSKMLIILGNGLEVVGNSLYCAARAPWMLLIGRFVAGLGAGSEVNLMSDMIRVTGLDERTTWVSVCLMVRQVGLIAGPCLTLVLKNVNTKVGQFPLDVYNAPLLVMVILWLIQTLQIIIFYPGNVENHEDESTRLVEEDSIGSDKDISEDSNSKNDSKPQTTSEKDTPCSKEWKSWMKTNGSASVFSAAIIAFIGYFCLMGYETLIPPMTANMLNWNEISISYLYLTAGIAVIIVFLAVQPLFKRFQDKTLILLGSSLLLVSYTIGTVQTSVYASYSNKTILIPITYSTSFSIDLNISIIALSLAFHVTGLVLMNTCADALFSKLIKSPKDNELGQAIIRTALSLSFLLGPAIIGSIVPLYFLSFVILLLSVSLTVVLAVKYL